MQAWEERYYWEKEAREAGHAAGLAAGHAAGHVAGQLSILQKLVDIGKLSLLEAAEQVNMSVEEFQKRMEELK